MSLIVAPGPASRELGAKISRELNARLAEVEFKVFPDGESYLRFRNSLAGEDVVIVQSTYPPQDTHLLQLFLLVDAARRLHAKSVTAAVPYLAYARQDREFLPGEAVSLRTVLRLLESLRLDRLITVNAHSPEALEGVSFSVDNVSAMSALAEYVREKKLKSPVVYAPDKKAVKLAEEVAAALGGEVGWFVKERDRQSGEISIKPEGWVDPRDRDALVVDDIISSGSTTASAVSVLRESEARRIFSVCVHPLLRGIAYDRIRSAGAVAVIGTDTVQSRVSLVSTCKVISEALRSSV